VKSVHAATVSNASVLVTVDKRLVTDLSDSWPPAQPQGKEREAGQRPPAHTVAQINREKKSA
jgi:hypothetical protein